jgi:hypothetical protein
MGSGSEDASSCGTAEVAAAVASTGMAVALIVAAWALILYARAVRPPKTPVAAASLIENENGPTSESEDDNA